MRYQSLNKSGAGFQLHFHPCCNLMFVKQVWVTLCNQSWNNTITLRFQQYHKQRWYLPHFPLDYVWCCDRPIADCSVSQRSTNHSQWDVRWGCCLFSSHLVLLIMSAQTNTHTHTCRRTQSFRMHSDCSQGQWMVKTDRRLEDCRS